MASLSPRKVIEVTRCKLKLVSASSRHWAAWQLDSWTPWVPGEGDVCKFLADTQIILVETPDIHLAKLLLRQWVYKTGFLLLVIHASVATKLRGDYTRTTFTRTYFIWDFLQESTRYILFFFFYFSLAFHKMFVFPLCYFGLRFELFLIGSNLS